MIKIKTKKPFKQPFLNQLVLAPGLLPFLDTEIVKLDTDLDKYEQLFLNPDIEKVLISKNELLASYAISKAENSTLTLQEAQNVYNFILNNEEYTFIADKLKNRQKLNKKDYEKLGIRVVPPAAARYGAYLSKGVILMPSYVNIGAYVDEGTMVDTWATVGSCAQIGKNVHLSGGVGIGGMLEPIQATPTIIEDNCFIGARSEIVEGVTVEHGSVISMGVFLGQSTKIYNRITGEITFGRIPAGSVVVPGSLPAADGSHSLYCAVIVKQVDERTRNKVDLNELLRWD